MEIAACQHMAVPAEVMQHVVNVESGYNPFAIGVVGGQLVRQPQNLGEAIATVHMLDSKGYNYSLGLAQVNRANLSKYGLTSYEQAFDICPNLTVGARILSECYASSGNDWGKSFSCYYSGNFVTGYRDGYVQKIYDSINGSTTANAPDGAAAIPLLAANGPSPSALRVSANGVTPIVATDSASYRLAIRSSMLDTAATVATRSIANALLPKFIPDPQTSTPSAVTQAPVAPATTGQSPSPTEALASASNDVFEPQVRKIGDTPQAAATNAGVPAPQMATLPSAPAVAASDQADLREVSSDSAFVF
ncbi:transglycosylase SLT domain-containing protein [Rhodanobacter sp. BL-MT-08]